MHTCRHTTGGVTYIPHPDFGTCNRWRRPACLVHGGVVHNSPLYNEPSSRECKGPSAMVVPCRLTALSNGFLYSLYLSLRAAFGAHVQAFGRLGYVHTCTLRPDFGYCNRCRRPCLWCMVAGGRVVHNSSLCNVPPSRKRKGPAAMVVLCRLDVFTCSFWCTHANIRYVGIHTGADVQVHGAWHRMERVNGPQ